MDWFCFCDINYEFCFQLQNSMEIKATNCLIEFWGHFFACSMQIIDAIVYFTTCLDKYPTTSLNFLCVRMCRKQRTKGKCQNNHWDNEIGVDIGELSTDDHLFSWAVEVLILLVSTLFCLNALLTWSHFKFKSPLWI